MSAFDGPDDFGRAFQRMFTNRENRDAAPLPPREYVVEITGVRVIEIRADQAKHFVIKLIVTVIEPAGYRGRTADDVYPLSDFGAAERLGRNMDRLGLQHEYASVRDQLDLERLLRGRKCKIDISHEKKSGEDRTRIKVISAEDDRRRQRQRSQHFRQDP